MDAEEIRKIIARGEDSKHQFKSDIKQASSLANEMAALANGAGGMIIVGVNDKDGSISGLDIGNVDRINQLVSNAATNNIRPAINPVSENFEFPEGLVIAVHVAQGINKPYMDDKGSVWVKSGADKRKVTSREELQRIFQDSSLVQGDLVLVLDSSAEDIDREYFDTFVMNEYKVPLAGNEASFAQLLENMKLTRKGQLTVCGTLIFARHPEIHLPVFIVKAVAFPGEVIHEVRYSDNRDIGGKLADVFRETVRFVSSNIRHIQNGQSVNSLGEPEIPGIVTEELVANALIHRDYLVSAPIKVLIFSDRVEIISPGHLPNNLTIENIKMGISNIRNPTLASLASKTLPYRGIGSGISRALNAYPDIELIDDRDCNTFKAIIKRKTPNQVSGSIQQKLDTLLKQFESLTESHGQVVNFSDQDITRLTTQCGFKDLNEIIFYTNALEEQGYIKQKVTLDKKIFASITFRGYSYLENIRRF